jgi:cellulose synthase/poly-beta-1,6-N-acetylglucosamine synthase-like glycosyltransferase
MVSVIVPCRDEGPFIAMCLDSILSNDYPRDRLEILVVDGMSRDGTRSIVEDYAGRYNCIALLNNPKGITPTALNLGIERAAGEVILWMSAHNTYSINYISRSVACLEESGADNVGGIMITLPREKTVTGLAIVKCLGHRFGVGNSYFRVHPDRPKWVDTVFGGCYRREVFDRIGLFNEALVRGQDMEFNRRLQREGGRILLVPDIVSTYYARSEFGSFWKHNWINGVWAVLPFLYSPIVPVSIRHLVPMVFVLSLIGSAIAAMIWPPGFWILLVLAGTYGFANLTSSFSVAWQQRDMRFFFLMPLVFGALHMGYGLGSLWGLLKLLVTPRFWEEVLKRWLRPYSTGNDNRHGASR